MKKLICIFAVIAMISALILSSCGEVETPEESVTYYQVPTSASESNSSGEESAMVTESSSASETETPTEPAQTETDVSRPTIPIEEIELPEHNDISACSIIPQDYDDHSVQLIAMGYTEGTEEYALYDALLDISCKAKLYLYQIEHISEHGDGWRLNSRYIRVYYKEIETIIKDLLCSYDIGYPSDETVPFVTYENTHISSTHREVAEHYDGWKRACYAEIDALTAIRALLSSGVLDEYAYTDALWSYLKATEENIDSIYPYIDDLLYNITTEITEEYVEETNMIRIAITTSGEFSESTYPGIEFQGKRYLSIGSEIESYTENDDGTVTLTVLLPLSNTFDAYLTDRAGENNVDIINDIGLQGTVYYIPGIFSGEYWNEPVKVESEHLHKEVSGLFKLITGSEKYSRFELGIITRIETGQRSGNKKYYVTIMINQNRIRYLYPDFYKNIDNYVESGDLYYSKQDGYYLIYEGEEIINISEEDLSYFKFLL